MNAQELMLKADTDKNQILRINLEKIIELRNISTHYITEGYEFSYGVLQYKAGEEIHLYS